MTAPAGRHAYLDWVRGVAVLIMIEAHVLDSWTAAADRTRPLFGWAMVLGGFGAPLFLFLAGVAAVLSAQSKLRRGQAFDAAWRAVMYRGWQIFGLAFLFRIQSYILSGGFSAASLLKVDILNIMGPGIVMAALIGRASRSASGSGLLLAGSALAVSLLSPIVRTTPYFAWLPDPVEWYFRPVPGRANFTLFPWVGFVFAGGALGVAIDRASRLARTARFQVRVALAGTAMAALAYLGSFQASLYGRSEFWTTSLSFFLMRVGFLTLLMPIGYAWERATTDRSGLIKSSPLQDFGRASLFVYWIHVEMVYGFFSRPLRRALSLEQALIAYALFTLFLFGLVVLKSRLTAPRPIYLTDSKSVI